MTNVSPFLRKLVRFFVHPKIKFFRILFPALLLWASSLHAQEMKKSLRNRKLIAYPLAFYSPETRAGMGLAATLNFRPVRKDTLSPVSQISLGAAFTQNKQMLLSVPFALYLNKRRHTLTGEFSMNDFWYYYYGTGSHNQKGVREKYTAEFPLFRINYLVRINRSLYVGARWWFEDYRIGSFETTESFIGQNKLAGKTSGPGLVFLLDTRDNIYYSTKGHYLELVAHDQSKRWGSDFAYRRYRADYRCFLPLTSKSTMAAHFFADYTEGNVPFNQLPGIGAGRRGRGFYEGRFRDQSILLLEAEYRKTLSGRWAMAAFMNYALLGQNPASVSLSRDHLAAGVGLRYAFDIANRTNVRLDIAFPIGGGEYVTAPDGVMKIYFAVNEAF
jgi:hemolysin activation/secretion protein